MTFTEKGQTSSLRTDSPSESDSNEIAVSKTARSTPSDPAPEESSPPPVFQRETRMIIWVDCPHCYGFGTTKMEWGEFYQTCLECNGNGLLEAEPDEE